MLLAILRIKSENTFTRYYKSPLSSFTVCRHGTIWSVLATPLASAKSKYIGTGYRQSFSLGNICITDLTAP